MEKKLTILILSLAGLLAATSSSVSATVLTFDDITEDPVEVLPIPDGYGGFNWYGYHVMDAINYYIQPSGYLNGLVSGNYVAWSDGQIGDYPEVSQTIARDEDFDFIGVYLTAAWLDGLNIAVEGYRDDALVYSQIVVVGPSSATWFDFNFMDIDCLRFTSSGGTTVPDIPGTGHHIVMDDFTFTPEPGTILLLGLGGALLRKRKAL